MSAVLAVTWACSWSQATASTNSVVTKDEVMAIAREEVIAREGWTNDVRYSSNLSGRLWHVSAVPVDPKTKQPVRDFSSLRTILITDQGLLVGYDGGSTVTPEERSGFERRLQDCEQQAREAQDEKYKSP